MRHICIVDQDPPVVRMRKACDQAEQRRLAEPTAEQREESPWRRRDWSAPGDEVAIALAEIRDAVAR